MTSGITFAVAYAATPFILRAATANERVRLEEFAEQSDLESLANESDEELEDEGVQSEGADADENIDQPGMHGDEPPNSKDYPKRETCYEVLDVTPRATRDQIEAAWHAKLKKNHPDRVAALDPEFQALAEERTKRLNAAHEEALGRLI